MALSVFPVSGLIMSLMYFERAYVAEPTDETIGLSGTSDLWILGNPGRNVVVYALLHNRNKGTCESLIKYIYLDKLL